MHSDKSTNTGNISLIGKQDEEAPNDEKFEVEEEIDSTNETLVEEEVA